MKALNINWEIDFDEIYEKLDEMTVKNAAKALELPEERYANMTTEERHDYAYDYFRHRIKAMEEFVGLPDEVEIPKEITSEEDITDYLSDEFGYLINGYELDTDKARGGNLL